jgi:hypothetical protein
VFGTVEIFMLSSGVYFRSTLSLHQVPPGGLLTRPRRLKDFILMNILPCKKKLNDSSRTISKARDILAKVAHINLNGLYGVLSGENVVLADVTDPLGVREGAGPDNVHLDRILIVHVDCGQTARRDDF